MREAVSGSVAEDSGIRNVGFASTGLMKGRVIEYIVKAE